MAGPQRRVKTKHGQHRLRQSDKRANERYSASVYPPADLPESVMAVLKALHPQSKFTKAAKE